MAPRTVEVTRDELLARRQKILDHLGMSLEEFRELVRSGALSGDEWDARVELRNIAFLLGDEADAA